MGALDELVGERTVVIDGGELVAFEKGVLVLAMRSLETVRSLWFESWLKEVVAARRAKLFWVVGVRGWDYLLSEPPPEELARAAQGVIVWSWRGEVVATAWPKPAATETV